MAEVENLEKGTREAAETASRIYTLRNYDKDLAKSGFECVMIKGSHYDGTTINLDNDPNGDVFGGETVVATVYQSGSTSVTISGSTYTFDTSGKIINSSLAYRLMLAEKQPDNNIVALLSKISIAIEGIEEKMSDMERGLSAITTAINNLELSPTINNYIEIPEE